MTDDQASEIQRSLGRIEGTLEGMKDLPERVRALEGWRKWILGIQAALAGVFVFLMKVIK